jgi:hypothetical protein
VRLLRHDSKTPREILPRELCYRLPADPDVTLDRRDHTSQQTQQGRFAGTVGTEEPRDRAGLDVQRDTVDHQRLILAPACVRE